MHLYTLVLYLNVYECVWTQKGLMHLKNDNFLDWPQILRHNCTDKHTNESTTCSKYSDILTFQMDLGLSSSFHTQEIIIEQKNPDRLCWVKMELSAMLNSTSNQKWPYLFNTCSCVYFEWLIAVRVICLSTSNTFWSIPDG